MKTRAIDGLGSEARHLLEAGRETPLLLTLDGKPVAVWLGVEAPDDLERLALWMSPEFQALLDRSRFQHAAGKGIDHEAFWQALAAEVEEST